MSTVVSEVPEDKSAVEIEQENEFVAEKKEEKMTKEEEEEEEEEKKRRSWPRWRKKSLRNGRRLGFTFLVDRERDFYHHMGSMKWNFLSSSFFLAYGAPERGLA
jgi:uncharacterized protein YnzC (UPF0291/DUF896 family)